MKDTIRELYLYILKNINDEELSLEKIEQVFHYDKAYISRAFKEYTGYSVMDFVIKVRNLNTIDPLILTNDKILKIALENGFDSQEYYSRSFKRNMGTSPLIFRKTYQELDKETSIEELKRKKAYLEELLEQRNNLKSIHERGKVLKRLP